MVLASVWYDFREGRVPSSSNDAGGLGNPFSQLQLVFGSYEDRWSHTFSQFPNSPPFCAQLSSFARAASSSFTLLPVFCTVWKQGIWSIGGIFQRKVCMRFPHTHQCTDMAQSLILRSLGQGSYLEIFCHLEATVFKPGLQPFLIVL